MVLARLCFLASSALTTTLSTILWSSGGYIQSARWHANTSEWKHMNHMEDLSVELAHLHGTAEERWNEERSCPLCSILSIRFE